MTNSTNWTPTQGRYLSYINAFTRGFGFPPAETEIAEALKVSPPSAHLMVKALEKKGFIRRKPGVPRSIEILVPPDTLPKWSKPIVSVRRVWMQVKPPANRRTTGGQQASRLPPNAQRLEKAVKIYRFKITLDGTEPEIWRRIETPDVSLERMHELIQLSMGWTNSHLHCFAIGDTRYIHPEFMTPDSDEMGEISYAGVHLSDLVERFGAKLKMTYEYDFGDDWRHTIRLENVTEAQPGARYPRCTDGARACPPEDIGGVWGYAEFLDVILTPDHPRRSEYSNYFLRFDPEKFDPQEATKEMKQELGAC